MNYALGQWLRAVGNTYDPESGESLRTANIACTPKPGGKCTHPGAFNGWDG